MAHWIASWGYETRTGYSHLRTLAEENGVTVIPSDRLGRWTLSAAGILIVDGDTSASDFSTAGAIQMLARLTTAEIGRNYPLRKLA
jgi:hypothetical protein